MSSGSLFPQTQASNPLDSVMRKRMPRLAAFERYSLFFSGYEVHTMLMEILPFPSLCLYLCLSVCTPTPQICALCLASRNPIPYTPPCPHTLHTVIPQEHNHIGPAAAPATALSASAPTEAKISKPHLRNPHRRLRRGTSLHPHRPLHPHAHAFVPHCLHHGRDHLSHR